MLKRMVLGAVLLLAALVSADVVVPGAGGGGGGGAATLRLANLQTFVGTNLAAAQVGGGGDLYVTPTFLINVPAGQTHWKICKTDGGPPPDFAGATCSAWASLSDEVGPLSFSCLELGTIAFYIATNDAAAGDADFALDNFVQYTDPLSRCGA